MTSTPMLTMTPCPFVKKGDTNDYGMMIRKGIAPGTLLLYNSNCRSDLLDMENVKLGGTAFHCHRHMWRFQPVPIAVGIPTGWSRYTGGFLECTRGVLKMIDLAFDRLVCFIHMYNINNVMYSCDLNDHAKMGIGIFKDTLSNDVAAHITQRLKNLPDDVRNAGAPTATPYTFNADVSMPGNPYDFAAINVAIITAECAMTNTVIRGMEKRFINSIENKVVLIDLMEKEIATLTPAVFPPKQSRVGSDIEDEPQPKRGKIQPASQEEEKESDEEEADEASDKPESDDDDSEKPDTDEDDESGEEGGDDESSEKPDTDEDDESGEEGGDDESSEKPDTDEDDESEEEGGDDESSEKPDTDEDDESDEEGGDDEGEGEEEGGDDESAEEAEEEEGDEESGEKSEGDEESDSEDDVRISDSY